MRGRVSPASRNHRCLRACHLSAYRGSAEQLVAELQVDRVEGGASDAERSFGIEESPGMICVVAGEDGLDAGAQGVHV